MSLLRLVVWYNVRKLVKECESDLVFQVRMELIERSEVAELQELAQKYKLGKLCNSCSVYLNMNNGR